MSEQFYEENVPFQALKLNCAIRELVDSFASRICTYTMEPEVEVNYTKKLTLNDDPCNKNSRFIGFSSIVASLMDLINYTKKRVSLIINTRCVRKLAAMLSLRNW